MHKRKTTDKNKSLVNVIENGLVDLANEIKEMSENEIENEKLYEIVHIFERVLYFNDKKPIRQGLKILTLNQILSRLPIYWDQLKVGNNSEKLINEIRQILHSLYRSKNLLKQSIIIFDQYHLKMEAILINTENSKTNKPHRFRLSLADKLTLKDRKKNMTLVNLSIYYT